MEVGDIYLVEIPLSGGHEQAGLRPAIIVQVIDSEKLPTVLIVPLTSKLKAADFPFTFLINGLKPPPLVVVQTIWFYLWIHIHRHNQEN